MAKAARSTRSRKSTKDQASQEHTSQDQAGQDQAGQDQKVQDQQPASDAGKAASSAPAVGGRDAVIDAAMALVAERGWARTAFADIAQAAGLSIAELYRLFPDRWSILAAFTARVDLAVLEVGDPEATDPPRDRLFDLLMRRFDALSPHRPAMRAIAEDARRDPLLALGGGARLLRSMALTLDAAGIGTAGLRGRLRAKALTALYLSVLRIWMEDESPDMSVTMAGLDRRLTRFDRILQIG